MKINDEYQGIFEDNDSNAVIVMKCKYLIPELVKILKIKSDVTLLSNNNTYFLDINPSELENLHCMGIIYLLDYKIEDLSKLLDDVLSYLEESQILLDLKIETCRSQIETSSCKICKRHIMIKDPKLHFLRTFNLDIIKYFWHSDMICDTCFNKAKLRAEIKLYKDHSEINGPKDFCEYMINRIKTKDIVRNE
jgi:hypothetical protein